MACSWALIVSRRSFVDLQSSSVCCASIVDVFQSTFAISVSSFNSFDSEFNYLPMGIIVCCHVNGWSLGRVVLRLISAGWHSASYIALVLFFPSTFRSRLWYEWFDMHLYIVFAKSSECISNFIQWSLHSLSSINGLNWLPKHFNSRSFEMIFYRHADLVWGFCNAFTELQL